MIDKKRKRKRKKFRKRKEKENDSRQNIRDKVDVNFVRLPLIKAVGKDRRQMSCNRG